eukprot:2056745-Rhodomonas_salina.1
MIPISARTLPRRIAALRRVTVLRTRLTPTTRRVKTGSRRTYAKCGEELLRRHARRRIRYRVLALGARRAHRPV